MIQEQNRVTQQVFPTLIQVTTHPNAEMVNSALLSDIEQIREETPNGRPGNWSCDLYTTMTNEGRLQGRSAFKEFADFAKTCAMQFGSIMSYKFGDKNMHLNDCWLNIYTAGHSQDTHVHQNNLISAVYFVAAPAGCSGLMFYSPRQYAMIQPDLTEITPINAIQTEYTPSPGDLVLFDSAVKHSVPVNETEAERITIAMNFSLEHT